MINVKNMTVQEFEELLSETEKKNIICFCAGLALQEICVKYSKLPAKILYVVDNYASDTQLEISGEVIPIRKMNRIGSEISKNILIISSIKFADEVVKQMDDMPMLEQCNVYIPFLFEDACEVSIPSLQTEGVLPKKIHYCWFGHGEMPERFKANIETWKKYCPDYEIIRWDESNYDVTKNKYMHQAYEKKKWGFVPDYARLDIIYEHGGIYLDTDVELIKPLDDLLQYKLFCGFEAIQYVNFGVGFGAQKKHPILKCMMEEYEKASFIKEDGSLNLIPSPVYQTKVLEKFGLIKNGKMQQFEDFVVLPTECFAPIDAYGRGYPKQGTFSIHQYAATWFEESQKREQAEAAQKRNYLLNRMKRGII